MDHILVDAVHVWSSQQLFTLLDLCVSSLRRGHANLLCIVPILTDDPRRESSKSGLAERAFLCEYCVRTCFCTPRHCGPPVFANALPLSRRHCTPTERRNNDNGAAGGFEPGPVPKEACEDATAQLVP